MENFPTLKRSLVPRVANGLTLLVMLAVTWWSSDQRPLNNNTTTASNTTSLPAQAVAPLRHPVAAPVAAAVPSLAVWPAQTTLQQADGIKPVGFATTALR